MDIEPLDADLWFAALGRLEQRLDSADESQLGQALRHAFHLQQLAPRWLRGLLRTRLDEYQFEDVLEHGNYEVAADALVGPPMTYTILQCGDELVQAAICLPGAPAPASTRAANRPAAILGAWLRCLQTLENLSSRNLEQLGRPVAIENPRTRAMEWPTNSSRRGLFR